VRGLPNWTAINSFSTQNLSNMGTLFSQLRIRLTLGALLFLLALTGAVILVVRDSLLLSARNMEKMRAEELLAQGETALLEISQREAELINLALHQNPFNFDSVNQRLQNLRFTPHTNALILSKDGNPVVNPQGQTAPMENPELRAEIPSMISVQSKTARLTLNGEEVLVAFAPLPEISGVLVMITPTSDILTLSGQSSASAESNVNGILKATLVTIGYFAVLVIIGIVLATRALTGPIQSLVEGTRLIAAGDLTARIPVKSSDEMGVLAESFNQMVEQLQARNDELTKAYETLSEREARLRLITEVTTDALYEWNVQTGKTQWSHSYRTLFGYPDEGQHEHMWWKERLHPEDLDRALAELEAALQNRQDFLSFEYRYRRADGSYAYVVDKGFIFYDEEGKPLRHVGAMIDITDRVTLSEAQARAALEERQRLARELHDSVTQSLYSLTLLAEASRRMALDGNTDKMIGNIARLGETAQQALKEMRLLVYELRPLALETAGLVEALQHRLDAVEKRAGVEARLKVESNCDLPADVENGLYRIAQEVLNNSLKHAEATRVSVRLLADGQCVAMEITDNGKGFDPQAVRDQGGMGLGNIQERAESLGGEVSFVSKSSEGTQVLVRVPLDRLNRGGKV
jgi:PAS domain S-box-containing protein